MTMQTEKQSVLLWRGKPLRRMHVMVKPTGSLCNLKDVSRQTAQRLGREAVRESGSEPIGPIEISDIECAKGTKFCFAARFWTMPEIEMPDFGSLAVRDEGPDPKDQISHRLLELISFDVPVEAVQAELGDEAGTVAAAARRGRKHRTGSGSY